MFPAAVPPENISKDFTTMLHPKGKGRGIIYMEDREDAPFAGAPYNKGAYILC
jgi:hypothetical protein